jgi:hypothetical protein
MRRAKLLLPMAPLESELVVTPKGWILSDLIALNLIDRSNAHQRPLA